VATSGQTLFHGADRNGQSLAYDPANQQMVQVFQRGLLLTPIDDYLDGVNQITLNRPATAGDIVQVLVTTLPAAWVTPQTVTSVDFTFYPPTGSNYTFLIEYSGAMTFTLGPGRTIGQLITIKDALGTAGSNPITVQAAATIDNNPTYTFYSAFASLTLIWTGVLWGTV
jgi:hypothetical protein